MSATKLIEAYNKANTDLAEYGIDVRGEYLEDLRNEVWNGDKDNPRYDWNGGEWDYGFEDAGFRAVSKDGLVFFAVEDNGGSFWVVFSEDKIEKHEED